MKNQELSPKVLRALRILQRNLKKNEPKVLRMFAKAGRKPDPTLVLVFSMYYDTFRKLAMDD